ncbi:MULTISPECIES: BMP family lipoprotein [unclassified Rathayibacter]|uniref:BMP family lipoprotein n=1 Tax=unclassified Rathayibacter TaxID=2609250 RepID=UPI00188D9ABC|nr:MULTISPECIES: BMP family ABC transporter substrate-binding protein [unclassified Rathayibacter]MBF4461854.1 BMP family ABC transporter substrate-binding protein [Rathayibacter sp. VKM Ac-2879]MBF4503267.1 BMP family ABC transporter substrate-binding protein [Rathayibacter sp. VKM Ac-2878]
MTITSRKAAFGTLAALGVTALLAGCASAPTAGGSSSAAAANSDFLPCMVSDSGGFDDKSFNELGYDGLVKASQQLGVTPKTVTSESETDYASNLKSLVDQGCNLIVTVGFALAEATKASATANPDIEFAIIDDASIDLKNVKPITFDTSQSAFLAGYAAASYSKTGVVGTYGGMQYPTVTIFMDGYADGVKYYNEKKGKDVKVVGWDVDSQTGSFTGGFAAGVEAKSAAQSLIDQNADVILPVGGPIFQSAIQAIRDSGKDIAMVGVDADLYETYPDGASLYLTSILKGIEQGTSDVTSSAGADQFDATPYVGTLKNEGVGLAPFHDFESKVSPDLQGELDTIKEGIIDGSIVVTSKSAPAAS